MKMIKDCNALVHISLHFLISIIGYLNYFEQKLIWEYFYLGSMGK